MKILITGSSGFVGSYVTRQLCLEHEIIVLTRPQTNLWRIKDCLNHVEKICLNMEDKDALNQAFCKYKPDVVIHLAWEGVGNAYRNDSVQTTNVINSINLLEAAIENGVKAWIGLGSQAEYGANQHKITEETYTQPTTLYGAAKLATYHLSSQRAIQAGLRFAWLRIFSTYGPADNPNWMIPYLINCLLKKERPSLTAGEQKWDYLYVEDAAQAICQVATHSNASGVFNLGSGKALPLKEIIKTLRDTINPELPLGFGEIPYRSDQVMHLEASIEKLKSHVGWEPSTSLSVGMHRTIAWHKQLESLEEA